MVYGDIPPISQALIDYVRRLVGPRNVKPTDKPAAVYFQAGRQAVLEDLEFAFKLQTEENKKKT